MKLNRSLLALLAGLALSTGLPQSATFSLAGIQPALADDVIATSDDGSSVGETGAASDEQSDGVTDIHDGDGASSNDTSSDNTGESLAGSRC